MLAGCAGRWVTVLNIKVFKINMSLSVNQFVKNCGPWF